MNAALGLGLGHPLNAVHAALVLQLRVRAMPVDLELDPVEAAFLARPGVHNLDFPTLLLRPLLIHAEEIGSKERCLLPTFRALDLDHDVAIVIGILRQQEDLQALFEIAHLGCRAPLLGAQVFLHLLVLLVTQQLSRRFHLVTSPSVLVVCGHNLPDGSLLAGELGHLVVVGCDVRTGHLCLDVVISLRGRLQPIYHVPPIVWPGCARPPPPNVAGMAGIVGGVSVGGACPPCAFSITRLRLPLRPRGRR